jgi:hypothetical protein
MKNRILLLVGLVVFLGSCTIQKRVYRPGYTIEWSAHKMQSVNNDQDIEATQENEERTANASPDNSEIQKVSQKEVSVSELNSSSDEPLELMDEVQNEQPIFVTETEGASAALVLTNNKTTQKEVHSKKLSIKKAATTADDGEGNSALKAIGWVFIILGIVFLLVVSIAIGVIMMLLGLLFFVVGKNN